MPRTKNIEETWTRDSTEAWNYERFENIETWTVIAHKDGCAGTLDEYAIAYEHYDNDTGEWSITPTHQIFTGEDAREEIYEYVGL